MTDAFILSPTEAQALSTRPNRDLTELRREPPDFWAAKYNCALFDLTHYRQERHFRKCKSFLREYQYATGGPDAERADELLRECQGFVETSAPPSDNRLPDMHAIMADPARKIDFIIAQELKHADVPDTLRVRSRILGAMWLALYRKRADLKSLGLPCDDMEAEYQIANHRYDDTLRELGQQWKHNPGRQLPDRSVEDAADLAAWVADPVSDAEMAEQREHDHAREAEWLKDRLAKLAIPDADLKTYRRTGRFVRDENGDKIPIVEA